MLKLSHYLVSQEIEHAGHQQTLVFSTRSSALYSLESRVWSLVTQKRFQDLPSALVDKLKEMKILVQESEDELGQILKENRDAIAQGSDLYTVIQPSANCNFGCGYCGQKHRPGTLSEKDRENVVKNLRQQASLKPYSSMTVCWFGGEPLLGLSALEGLTPQLKSLAQEKGLKYSAKIVTNGFHLRPDIADRLVREHNVTFFEITLDGSPDYHNNRRHSKDGGPTFDKIYDNLKYLINTHHKNVTISLRSNVDHRNKDGVLPLLRLLQEDGLHNKVSFYMAPLHSWGNDAHLLAAEKHSFAEWEVDFLVAMKEMGFPVSFLPTRTKSVCMAVQPDSLLIDPMGGVFGCTEHSLVPFYEEAGVNKHRVSTLENFTQETNRNKRPFLNFYNPEDLAAYDCSSCEMLPTCGGSCPKEWQEGRVPCPSTKFNIKQKMVLEYAYQQRPTPPAEPVASKMAAGAAL